MPGNRSSLRGVRSYKKIDESNGFKIEDDRRTSIKIVDGINIANGRIAYLK